MKIIDALMFAWELDVLLLRLHELDSVVTDFIIVESLEHHGSTNPKTANLRANWEVIKPFEHKIKYYVLENLFPPLRDRNDVWPRENFHRNFIGEVVKEIGASPTDILLVSDCDEIPRAETIRQNLLRLANGICGTRQEMFYYSVQILSQNGTGQLQAQ